MALNIKDPRTDGLARRLAATTGETLTQAIASALEERLARVGHADPRERKRAELARIAERAAMLPVLDDRSSDEILDYDEHGLPR